MGQGYIRNDTTNQISNGNNVDADALDGEFDAIVAAFNGATGHSHDGTTGEGGPVNVLGPTQDVEVTAISINPRVTNTVDLGSSMKQFKNVYVWDKVVAAKLEGQVKSTNIEVEGTTPLFSMMETDSAYSGSYWYSLQSGDQNFNYWFNGTEPFPVYRQRFNSLGAIEHTFYVGGEEAAKLYGPGITLTDPIGVLTREKGDDRYFTKTLANATFTPIEHVGSGGASHSAATTSVSGFMSSADKTKLNGISPLASTVVAGTGITVTIGAGPSSTVAHGDTSTLTSINNSNGVVIQDLTVDTFGHVTAAGSVDLDNRYLRLIGGELSSALTLSGGLNFTPAVAAVRTDFSKHIDFSSGLFGVSITPSSLNFVVTDGVFIYFTSGEDVDATVGKAGTAADTATTLMTREKTDSRYYTKTQTDNSYTTKSANLGDLADAVASRTNLGLGSLATQNEGTGGAQFRDNAANDARFAVIADAYPGHYTGSSVSNVTFPIGEVISVFTDVSLNRNATTTVRLSTTEDRTYVDSGTGAILTGTWRSRGQIGGGYTLMVRVA